MTQAEGVYNQRLQNLAVTLDKVIVPPPLLFLLYFSALDMDMSSDALRFN